MKTKELVLENMGEQYALITLATLKPQPIPCSVKIIMIGSPLLYHLLCHYDDDFQKLFKIKADFDTKMTNDATHIENYVRLISAHCHQEGLRHFHRSGISKVLEYASRLAESQNKLTTCFHKIAEVLYEADAWAGFDGHPYVTGTDVTRAIQEKRYRSERYQEKLNEFYTQDILLLDTQGFVIGQVNGLSVIDLGDYFLGKPTRITAATFLGDAGVINIEREIKKSGPSHSKGVLILSGYLGTQYAQLFLLALSASLCFEQLYEGIDGDSASSAELYALLSSLAEVPLNQGIAVTGSVNQKGEIQPVGSVTDKIEGFFRVCRLKGLTGTQGVIIPEQNCQNLMLDQDIVEAVQKGSFHIYPVRTIDAGLEILSGGQPAGKKDPEGNFPLDSIHGRVMQKLKKYHQRTNVPAKENGPFNEDVPKRPQ
jgi:predicted ATP-dependent protease